MDWPTDETATFGGEAANSTLETLVDLEATAMGDESTSDIGHLEIWRKSHEEDIQDLLQLSRGFDPKFDPNQAPRIALLCQTCHAALEAATYLAENETNRRELADGAVRVRIWGMDILDADDSTPLDDLLDLTPGTHTFLRGHITGVWADIAATLELILLLLLLQIRRPNPETCTQWRRLRIVLGLDGISTAVHADFDLPRDSYNNPVNGDLNDALGGLVSSLEGLIDCLFDLLVTIGTIRQLYKHGFGIKRLSSPVVCASEDQEDGSITKPVLAFPSPPTPLSSTTSNSSPLLNLETERHPETGHKSSRVGSMKTEMTGTSTPALRDVSEELSDGTISPSRAAASDGPKDIQTSSPKQEDPSEIFNTDKTLESPKEVVGNYTEQRGHVSLANTGRYLRPIKFIDCRGRIFSFPFSLCMTWKGTEDMMIEAGKGLTDSEKEFIKRGDYDIVGHFNNETIMPRFWDSMLEPGMAVRMVLYQLPPDLSGPASQFPFDTQRGRKPSEYRRQSSREAFSPFVRQEEYTFHGKDRRYSQENNTKEQKESVDENTTPTASTAAALGTLHADTVSRPNRHRRALPSTSSLPYFKSLGIERKSQQNTTLPKVTKASKLPATSTGYMDSTYSSVGNTPFFNPQWDSRYANQDNSSYPDSTKLVPHSTLSYVQPAVAAPLKIQSPTPPQYLDLSQADSERKQKLSDNKYLRDVEESATRKFEDRRHARAGREQSAAEGIDTADTAAAAIARLEFTRKESKKLAAESEKAEVNIRERAAADTEPIHFIDLQHRKIAFPYQLCRTWQGMDDLVKKTLLHFGVDSYILEGHYNLLDPNGDTLIPAIWEHSVEPGWTVTMAQFPLNGYEPLLNDFRARGLPNPDSEIITIRSTSGSQAFGINLSNPHTSLPVSTQSEYSSQERPRPGIRNVEDQPLAPSNVAGNTTPRDEYETFHPPAKPEEIADEELKDKGKMSKWKSRFLHPLRTEKSVEA